MLNPKLFQSLQDRFGEVRVANEGEERIAVKIGDKIEVRQSGEQYRICCPYCRDLRFRLYISYVWNTADPEGMPNDSLAICFNERCDVSRLHDELQVYLMDKPMVGRSPFAPFMPIPPAFTEVNLPGMCIPLSSLEAGHPARVYVTKRRFDPYELTELYGVSCCVDIEADERGFVPGTKWLAAYIKNRLVVPMYRLGKLVGWQTRALDEYTRPKYYTMPGYKKALTLYNRDRAQQFDFGVVVEGVTDVWRVGPCAVALLGHSISNAQRDLIYAFWQRGGMCLLLDPDVMQNAQEVERWLDWKSFMLGAFPFCLPYGVDDPGSMERRALWDTIAAAARCRGVRLAHV